LAKPRIQFVCQNCGTVHQRWAGKCDSCGEWNTLIEEGTSGGIGAGPASSRSARKGRVVALTTLSGEIEDAPRIVSGIGELDRATGGGFVRGSALLVGGDPGIGKSTLLTQAAAALAHRGHRVVYVSGEEAVAQIRLRAQRGGGGLVAGRAGCRNQCRDILATIADGKRPDLVILDSIQTLWTDLADSAPGTVTQVRASAQALIRYAKSTGAAVVMVGHVTKEGQIAGPRVVEHMVDAVLYFEGEGGHHYRILRTVKNRFGPTDEIGVFEMSDGGLREVANPSELFLGERHAKSPGAAVFAGMEGTRPVLVDIQALVAPSSLGTPRRAVVGWDGARLAMILAVLEAHCGCASASSTSISTSRAATASPSRRRIWRWRRRWFRRSPDLPFPRLRLFRRNQPFGCRKAGCARATSVSKEAEIAGFLKSGSATRRGDRHGGESVPAGRTDRTGGAASPARDAAAPVHQPASRPANRIEAALHGVGTCRLRCLTGSSSASRSSRNAGHGDAGFSREVLSIASWAAAAAAALLLIQAGRALRSALYRQRQDRHGRRRRHRLVIALIVVSVFTMKIADFIIDQGSARSTARSASSTAPRAASWWWRWD